MGERQGLDSVECGFGRTCWEQPQRTLIRESDDLMPSLWLWCGVRVAAGTQWVHPCPSQMGDAAQRKMALSRQTPFMPATALTMAFLVQSPLHTYLSPHRVMASSTRGPCLLRFPISSA